MSEGSFSSSDHNKSSQSQMMQSDEFNQYHQGTKKLLIEDSDQSDLQSVNLSDEDSSESEKNGSKLVIPQCVIESNSESLLSEDTDSVAKTLPTVDYTYRSQGIFGWIRHLFRIYNTSVIIVIGLKYFMQGCQIALLEDTVQIFQNLGVEPAYAQISVAIINIPQVPVFFYGIFIESVPIFNSRKKSWILIMSAVQICAFSFLTLTTISSADKLTAVMSIVSFCFAVIDTVVDGLWVTQVRKDSKYGSDDLQVFSWICLSIGGICSSIAYAVLGHQGKFNLFFAIPLCVSVCQFVSAFFISQDIDGDAQKILDMDIKTRFRFNLKAIKQGLKDKALRRMFLFFLVLGLLTPNFDDFLDFYVNFGPIEDSIKDILLFSGILLLTLIYEFYLIDTRIRRMMLVAISAKILNSFLNLLLSLGFTFGLTNFQMISLKCALLESTFQTYNHIPINCLVAKLIPINVEASMFAILTGIQAFTQLVYGRLLGCLFNTFFNVTTQDTSQFWCLMAIEFVFSILPLAFLWLLPTKTEVISAQTRIHEQEVIFKKGVTSFNRTLSKLSSNRSLSLVNSFREQETKKGSRIKRQLSQISEKQKAERPNSLKDNQIQEISLIEY